ncbi:MAG: bifunctional methylenetetrahydrofolate dehydrogenase/methenyltetrahydrofolate cyclohydrolase FolD [Coriobacteriia bacterium]|nr:bifunctional methylenetetrahydrofolate dehydrogenase/methenyltetrahydrofolate cyclohydrolase FolD [Coriobacteriia bacterium]
MSEATLSTDATARIIDGRETAALVKEEVRLRIAQLREETGASPCLAMVLVGEDPASQSYVRMKARDCEQVGIIARDHHLSADVSQEHLDALIDELNADAQVNGILVQMPLPVGLDEEEVVERIDPAKDVDGFHPVSLGRLLRGLPGMRPCTPAGVMALLDQYGIELEGKHAVVVGRSNIVGKPQAILLLERNATVTICHSRTCDLPAVCRTADVLVAAVGHAQMIDASYIKPGATVIDVGINRTEDGTMVGDVDFESARAVAGAITPVPGGVGVMTRALLMRNTVEAFETQQSVGKGA